MIPRVNKLSASSPTPSGGRGSRMGGQLEIAFLPGGALLQGTELQLSSGLRSAMSSANHYGPATGAGRMADLASKTRSDYGALPPPPRKAGLLADSELLSGDDIRSMGVVTLFKTEPMLKGKCTALYVREAGCTWGKCNYCATSLREAASTDQRDLAQAIRRAISSSNARSRPGAPGGRRSRSGSAGSATSVGS